MKEANKNYCDVSRVTVREISSSVAKEIIVKKTLYACMDCL